VIVPAHTFIATWLAVSYAGATPVPVDVEPQTFNIDVAKIEAAITSRTRAIMPVHLYGHPADMEPIRSLAARYGLKVVEDAAQAHGTRYRGTAAGALGDAAGFSFYPGKNLGAFADAGAVVTNDDELAAKVRKLRNYGSSVKYHHDAQGINSRIDELTAAFLRVKLAHLPQWNERRKKIAARYTEELRGVPGLLLPQAAAACVHAWHLYVVRHPQRDRLKVWLEAAGVGVLIHYPIPAHLSPAYQQLGYRSGSFPVTEEIASAILSLPIGPHLEPEQVGHVVRALRDFH
jgi:dTDP-3-amino-3,4,6-trideoxy-alpha-D-glucose transaminase